MGSLNTTWKHIRRSPYQSMAAILTMFITLLLSGIFFLTSATSVLILRYFESKPQITVFFTEEATDQAIQNLQTTLQETGKTSGIVYVSREQALEIYKDQNKDDPLLLEMVTADILPASLEIQTKEPQYLQEIEALLTPSDIIEEVVFQKDIVETLISWTNATRLVVGVLAVLLAVDAILLLITITSMKIAVRREEIEILRLVGASRWYIRLPFVWEGASYGVFGSLIAWGVISGILLWIRPVLLSFLGMIPLINMLLTNPASQIYLIFEALLMVNLVTVGFVLGSFGSIVAVNRYLKI